MMDYDEEEMMEDDISMSSIPDEQIEVEIIGLVEEEEEVDFLSLARDAFIDSSAYFDNNIRPGYEKDIKQFNGKHEDPKYYSNAYRFRHNFFKPKTRTAIKKHEAAASAAFFSTNDVVNITPVNDSDPAQRASAEFKKEIMNLRLTGQGSGSIAWFKTLIGAYQNSMVYGNVVSKQTWNHAMKRPEIKILEPENVRFDPAADWMDPVSSSPYFIELIPMYVHELKQRIKNDGWNDVSESQMLASRGTQYDSIRAVRENSRLDPKERENSISEYDITWVHLNIIRHNGDDYVFYTLGTEELLTDAKPIAEVFLHGKRPYVIGSCMIESHKAYVSSLPYLTRDTQRELNDITNQRMDNVKLVLDKRYFLRRNQRIDFDSVKLNAPGSITLLDNPATDVKVIDTPDITGSSYREMEILNNDFDDLSGSFSQSSVQTNKSLNETVGGMSMISQAANQVGEYQMTVFKETWVEPVLRQVLILESHYESDEVILMMAGNKAGLIERHGVNMIDDEFMAHDVMLSVAVGMGATNPATQLEKFMMALRSLEVAIPGISRNLKESEVVTEVFGKLGYKDGARFFKNAEERVDPEKESLMEQIRQLTDELKRKKSPELESAEAALKRAQTIKTNVEASFGAMQAGEAIAQMPDITPIGDVLLKSAGYKPEGVGIDPNIDSAVANAQATVHPDVRENNDPLEPNTGMNNFNVGIRGGVDGMSDRG